MRADGLMKAVAATAVVAASFVAGYHAASMNYERDIAELKESYAQSERDAMRRAEELRQEHEAKFLSELEAVKRDAADRSADDFQPGGQRSLAAAVKKGSTGRRTRPYFAAGGRE